MRSEKEMEMDQEMTQSETDMEEHELQDILDKENLDLEGFLMQGTKEKKRFSALRRMQQNTSVALMEDSRTRIGERYKHPQIGA